MMARLMAINRRLLSQSNQRLDFASGPESDFEDAEDLRLKLDVNDYIQRRESAAVGPHLEDLRHQRIRSCSMGSGTAYKSFLSDENGRERKSSTQSDGGSSPIEGKLSPVFIKNVQRRTSQSMEDAFLEQLPEVKPKNQCNGSTSDEGS